MRGAGKTFLAKKLKTLTGIPSIDTDQYIEKKYNMKIIDMVKNYGWEYFRNKEYELLVSLLKLKEKRIIALGGGMTASEKNQEIIIKLGTVVWVDISIDIIKQRLKQSSSKRPALKGDNIVTECEKIYLERRPVYEKLSSTTFCNTENKEKLQLKLSQLIDYIKTQE